MKAVVVTEEEMKKLAFDNPYIVAACHFKDQFKPEVIAVDQSKKQKYICNEPFDKYWWASDDPKMNNYVPIEERI